uniref:Uncharacterized protein n=1 Tax=Arundo donax TaxID=35708 RepID=A0A0A9TKX4_ARUDO
MLNVALVGADHAVHILHDADHARLLLPYVVAKILRAVAKILGKQVRSSIVLARCSLICFLKLLACIFLLQIFKLSTRSHTALTIDSIPWPGRCFTVDSSLSPAAARGEHMHDFAVPERDRISIRRERRTSGGCRICSARGDKGKIRLTVVWSLPL